MTACFALGQIVGPLAGIALGGAALACGACAALAFDRCNRDGHEQRCALGARTLS
jgi:hypothetical protein